MSPVDMLALEYAGSSAKDIGVPSALELSSQYVIDVRIGGELISVFVDSGSSD